MFNYFFILCLSLISCTLYPSIIHMTIMEKEVSPNLYHRRILLGDLHGAETHNISAQEKAITTSMESFEHDGTKAHLYYEGTSEKSMAILHVLADVADNPGVDLDSTLFGLLLSGKNKSNVSLFDPREQIMLIINFIKIVGSVIAERIEDSQNYDDVLTKLRDTYTFKSIIDEYQKSIDAGIDACVFLQHAATNQKLKEFAEEALQDFNYTRNLLKKEIVNIPEKIMHSNFAELFASSFKKRITKRLSAAENSAYTVINFLKDFRDSPLCADILLEFSFLGKLLSERSPEIIITLSGEIHNQSLINFLAGEGFEALYDSEIHLKNGGFVSSLFTNSEFSEEWDAQFPKVKDTNDLERFIDAISARELALMTKSREELIAMKNDAKSHYNDEL